MKRDAIIYCIIRVVLYALVFTDCIALVGCKCPECVTTTEVEKTIEVRTRDTILVTEADSASIHALFKCDSAYNVIIYELVTMQGERIAASVQTSKHGKDLAIAIDCKEDSLVNKVQLRDSIISTLQKNTTIVREKYVPGYYKFVSWGFWILLVVLILIGAWKIAKVYLKHFII